MSKRNRNLSLGELLLDEIICNPFTQCYADRRAKMAKPQTSDRNSPPKGQTRSKSGSTAKPRRSGSKTGPRRSEKKFDPKRSELLSETSALSDQSVEVSRSFVSNADVSYDATTSFDAAYPQVIDLFHYGIKFFPTGTLSGTNTIARDEFVNSYGLKMLVDIRNALSYNAATPLTVTHVADYINVVADSYFLLSAIRNHFGLCYSDARRASLRARFQIIYDESIQPEYSKLASALSNYFLPKGVVAMCEHLATPSLTSPTVGASYVQTVPYAGSLNTPSDFVGLIQAALSSLSGITNQVFINTALSSSRYNPSSVIFQPVDTNIPDKFDFFFKGFQPPKFVDEFIDLWMNLPLEANTAASAVVRNAVANETTTMIRHYIGNSISMKTNAMTPRFLTSTGFYEPGFIQPYDIGVVGANNNNLRVIVAAGTDNMIAVGGATTTAMGVMSRIAENAYSVALPQSITPAGSNFIRTNFQRVRNDVADVMKILVS